MKRRALVKAIALAVASISLGSTAFAQQKTIKVGVLHSLSGTMAISETVLKDTVLMAIEEVNAGARRRHDQGRCPSLAVGHDGDQRDGAEGRHANDDR